MKVNLFKVTVFTVAVFLLISCSSKNQILETKELEFRKSAFENYQLLLADRKKKDEAIKKYVLQLSLEEKISQIFMINLENDDKFFPVEWYDAQEKQLDGSIKKIKKTLIPAGYIFFGYNISKEPNQIIEFTNSILEHAALQKTILPFLSIDVEGGFVNRLRGVAGPLPENERVSQCISDLEAYKLYCEYAKQIFALGFNLNLAPVAEICTDENKDFLSGRSYGDKSQVISFCTKAVNAYQNNKVATVLKHFPGNTNLDPHIGLPKIEMTEQEFQEVCYVFKTIAQEKPEGILMSHAIVSTFDEVPACLSKFWITDILRNKLCYDGIIFSDDIFMSALINHGFSPAKASKMAVEAGVNCIMISEKKFGKWLELLIEICKQEPNFLSKIEESVVRILKFKERHNLIFLTYNKESDTYSVNIPSLDELKNYLDEEAFRIKNFSLAKENSIQFYNEHFLETASEEEKKGLYIN